MKTFKNEEKWSPHKVSTTMLPQADVSSSVPPSWHQTEDKDAAVLLFTMTAALFQKH